MPTRAQARTTAIAAMILGAVLMYATVLWNLAKLGHLERELARSEAIHKELGRDIDMWQMYVQDLARRMERAGIQVPDMPTRGDP